MILPRLKADTAEQHARTESAMPSLDELARPAAYGECLRAMHAFHAVWEPAVWRTAGVTAAIADWPERGKLALLARDLEALRLAPLPTAGIAAPELDCPGALGALYVMEGASLGGRVITRHIAAPLGLTARSGLAYFSGYGEATGAMWKAFGLSLDRWVAANGEEDAIVSGAVLCFEALERWLLARSLRSAA